MNKPRVPSESIYPFPTPLSNIYVYLSRGRIVRRRHEIRHKIDDVGQSEGPLTCPVTSVNDLCKRERDGATAIGKLSPPRYSSSSLPNSILLSSLHTREGESFYIYIYVHAGVLTRLLGFGGACSPSLST